MKSKMFEIRDYATCMTVIAIKTDPDCEEERAFYSRGGWGKNSIILVKTNGEAIANYDAFEWRKDGSRTLFEAHRYIEQHFDELENFSVVDVEYILGLSDTIKSTDILGGQY